MNSLLVVLFLILSGCQHHSEPINRQVLKGSLEILATPTVSFKSIDYYNNKYKSVLIDQSSGNPMRDALDALYSENDLESQFTTIELAEISVIDKQTVYSFKGQPKYPRALDGKPMPKRFDISISRNREGLNYSIAFMREP